MRKIILFLGILLYLLASCKDKNAFTLTGILSNSEMDGKYAYFLQLDSNFRIGQIVDSAKIVKNKFVLKGVAEEIPVVNFLSIAMSRPLDFVIIEKGTIEMIIDSAMQVTLKGTTTNEQYQNFKNISGNEINGDNIYNLIKPNMTNQLGQWYFLNAQYYLTDSQLKELISLSTPDFINKQSVQILMKRIETREATAVGKKFTDVKGLNFNDKEVKLSDYAGNGKVVLVDFWASWCGPCIADMPDVIALYKKYNSKGFEIVGISLDNNKDNWKKSTDNLNITWPQFSNLKGWEEDCAKTYGVNSIPHTVLIDKDGTIIERNLRGEALKNKLEALFGK